MNFPVILIGGGGHASVLIDALKLQSVPIVGIVDTKLKRDRDRINGIPVLGDDEAVETYDSTKIRLVNGVGSVKTMEKRKEVFERFKRLGYTFYTVIHPSAIIASNVTLGEGVQIMAGAIIQTGTTVGVNTIINTGASVDHDCIIGSHVHLGAGVTLSGSVRIDDETHVGTRAIVVQNIEIGKSEPTTFRINSFGSIVVQNTEIGKNRFIRAGSLVTHRLIEEDKTITLNETERP